MQSPTIAVEGAERMAWLPRYRPLSLPRRWIGDVLYFSKRSYIVGGSRVINIAPLVAARRECGRPVSWAAIMLKALALLSRDHPKLRQSYMPFPWGHLYEHPVSVATIVIEREWRGEFAVFFEFVIEGESIPVFGIDAAVRGMKANPVESNGAFRRLIRIAKWPMPLRRLLMGLVLRFSGRLRSRYFGTFSVNSLPSRRVQITQSTTPNSYSLFFGPVEANGDLEIMAFFDHRVFDGMDAARISSDLEKMLNRTIADELLAGRASPPSAAEERV